MRGAVQRAGTEYRMRNTEWRTARLGRPAITLRRKGAKEIGVSKEGEERGDGGQSEN
jgi:hypothetical protein